MVHKIKRLRFIPKKRPLLQWIPAIASLSLCFLVARRRFKRAAPISFWEYLKRMFPMSESIGILITICIQAAFRFSGSFFLVATLIPLLGKTDGNATFAAANSC